MATNTVNGVLVCSDGTNIPMKTEIAEGSESSLKTDSVYTVSSIDVGDYAPGKTVTAGLVSCDNGVGYAGASRALSRMEHLRSANLTL